MAEKNNFNNKRLFFRNSMKNIWDKTKNVFKKKNNGGTDYESEGSHSRNTKRQQRPKNEIARHFMAKQTRRNANRRRNGKRKISQRTK